MNAYLAKIITEILLFILSYFVQKHLIFSKQENVPFHTENTTRANENVPFHNKNTTRANENAPFHTENIPFRNEYTA